jgi:hypothetical protein
MMTREQAEVVIRENREFETEDGWKRTITILELEQMPLAETEPEDLKSYKFFLFEKMCWACRYQWQDTFKNGKSAGVHTAYCYVIIPEPVPLVLN